MTTDEIADLMGWSEPKARNLVYRGLKDLRKALRDAGIEYKRMKLTEAQLKEILQKQTARATPRQAKCLTEEQFVRAVTGEMGQQERAQMASHLVACSDCAEEYRILRSLRPLAEQAEAILATSTRRKSGDQTEPARGRKSERQTVRILAKVHRPRFSCPRDIRARCIALDLTGARPLARPAPSRARPRNRAVESGIGRARPRPGFGQRITR